MRFIEVFADVSCPYTHVGLRRVVERREQLNRHDVVLRVRSWPLELVNGTPLSGGVVAEEIAELQRVAAPDLFARFNPDQFPRTTLPALMLETAAYLQDDLTGQQVSLVLRSALFEECRDVADPAVLASIAASVGLDVPGPETTRAVQADWHEGQRRGVKGSPYFFVGGNEFFCPSLTIQHVSGHLRISVDQAAAEDFLAQCFQ